jgi:hypothetical protein
MVEAPAKINKNGMLCIASTHTRNMIALRAAALVRFFLYFEM